MLTRSASASSRRAPARVTSPPPAPQSPTPSYASTSTTPRQSDFGFPPNHRQQPLSPIPRRASASARLTAGFMTPGTSPNHPFAALPEEAHENMDGGRTSAPPMRISSSSSAGPSSTRSYTGARSLGVASASHPSSPSGPSEVPTARRPNSSKRSHTSASVAPTRCISRTLPHEERSLHVPGDSKRPLTAEVCLRGLLDKSGGPCASSSAGGRMAIDLDSLNLEEELRKAQETLEADMIRWANGEGDVPRLLALQEAINAARPGSSMSAHSGQRRPSHSTSDVHPRHGEGDMRPTGGQHGPAVGRDHSSLSTSPRAGLAERRPTLDVYTKKRTHSTSSSPSIRSITSGLGPISSSPRSLSQHKLPSPLYAVSDLPSSVPSSGPSSASTASYSGPLPTQYSQTRSPHSRPPTRSITMPIPAPSAQSPSSPPPPSSLTSVMSSSSSIHTPSASRRPSSSRTRSSARPSFSHSSTPGSPALRAVSQPLVPTRARLGSECLEFDLESSYQKCNEQEGYVSFADMGVGCPLGDEEDEGEQGEGEGEKKAGGSWWGWLAGAAGESAAVKS